MPPIFGGKSLVTNLDFARIQFTPDLMPADIVGTSVLVQGEEAGGQSR
ncbi:MAG: AAA family ATPase, partial [Planctomycetota bacterium]